MKKSILLLIMFSFVVLGTFGQAPEYFRQQMIARDKNNHTLTNKALSALVSIRMGSEAGTVIYSESFILISNLNGLVNFTIGMGNIVSGNLSSIDWYDGPYYIETSIDPNNGNNYTISYIQAMKSVPFAIYSNITGFAHTIDFNNLMNKPQIITQEQSNKVNLLTVTALLNLDLLRNNVTANNQKVSFPGFGNTAGKAYEIHWSKIGDDTYYPGGAVCMGVSASSGFGSSVLQVNGAVLQEGVPSENTPGLYYYNPDSLGYFTYFDNSNAAINLSKNIKYIYEGWTGVYDLEIVHGQPVYTLRVKFVGGSDFNAFVKNKLLFGNGAKLDYDMNGHAMALVDGKIRIKFVDTSTTSSFPDTDWQLVFNDADENGDNYFAVADISNMTVPLKIMAGSPDHTFYINPNGNVGISNDAPAYPLDVNGNMQAIAYIGDASMLTGTFTGTGLLVNTGSTTLNADSDVNMNGDLEFATQNTNRLVITNSGDVKIGSGLPSAKLDVDGTTSILGGMQITNALHVASPIPSDVYDEPNAGGVIYNYDVMDKNVVIFNPTSDNINIRRFINGAQGQKITLINKGTNDVVLSISGMPTSPYTIPMNGSVTFVCSNGYQWLLTDAVTSL